MVLPTLQQCLICFETFHGLYSTKQVLVRLTLEETGGELGGSLGQLAEGLEVAKILSLAPLLRQVALPPSQTQSEITQIDSLSLISTYFGYLNIKFDIKILN